jgi:hypothetical protein
MRVAYWAAGVCQILHKKEKCPSSEDVSHSGLWPNVAREWCPWLVIRRTCHAVDIGQMWQKNDAPRQRTLSHCGLWPNVVQIVPLVGGLFMQRTSTKCGPICAPCWRTLSHSGLQPNVVQTVPLVGGFCLTADFNQMWSKYVPLVGRLVHAADFKQMWSKHLPLDGWLCFATEFDYIWIDNVLIIKESQYQTSRS